MAKRKLTKTAETSKKATGAWKSKAHERMAFVRATGVRLSKRANGAA